MTTNQEQTIVNKTDRPNSMSFRTGGAGTPEFKIYFENAADLELQINAIAGNDEITKKVAEIKKKYGGE